MSNATLFELDERGVATVTLNRPEKYNAFDDSIIAELSQVFKKVNASADIRLMILAANGKHFSAGGDLAWMQRMADYSYAENLADAKKLAQMFHQLNTLNKPTIARVQGAAFGGAVGLVSCCDMVVAETNASFCLSEVKVGIAPATISPYVIAAIGARAARRYFLTAERFCATSARALGLVSEVVKIDNLDHEVERLIKSVLANSPQAVSASKQLIFDVQHQHAHEQLIEQTSELIAALRVSEEGQEGLAAFFEKRAPAWQTDQSE